MKRAGISLIDLLFGMTISVVVLGSAGLVSTSAVGAFRSGADTSLLEDQVWRAVDRIGREARLAGVASLDDVDAAPLSDDAFVFDQAASAREDDGEPVWRTVRIERRAEDGEPENGLDDDGDGLVDEGVVVMIRDWGTPDAREVVLARSVSRLLEGETDNGLDDNGNELIDESGLSFDRAGNALTIRLTLERLNSDGVRMVRTVESCTWLRN